MEVARQVVNVSAPPPYGPSRVIVRVGREETVIATGRGGHPIVFELPEALVVLCGNDSNRMRSEIRWAVADHFGLD